MIRLLQILWPALLPLLFYAGWCILRYRKKQAGEEVPALAKPFFRTLVSMIVIGALCFVLLGMEQSANEGRDYHPTRYKDGVLVPGGFAQ